MTTELVMKRPTGSPVAVKTSVKFLHSNSVGMTVNAFCELVRSLASEIEIMRTNGTKKIAETTSSTA